MSGPQDAAEARQAAERIRRMDTRVRRAGRRAGWIWLLLGAATFAFFVGVGSGRPLPLVVGAVGFALAARQRVVSAVALRVERPAAYAFMATAVAASAVQIAVQPHAVTWWLVVLTAGAATPCLVAAWRVLRRPTRGVGAAGLADG